MTSLEIFSFLLFPGYQLPGVIGEGVVDPGNEVGEERRVEIGWCGLGLPCPYKSRLPSQTSPMAPGATLDLPPLTCQLFLALGCAEHATEK